MSNVKKVIAIPAKVTAQEKAIETEKPKRRVAGYARVSTDKDEQFTSYEAQVDYYTDYIKRNKDWKLVKIYTDEGISGTSTKHRAGFNEMVKDALGGKIDLIITKSVSRFARNTVDSLTAIRELKTVGCECFFEKENIWTFDSKGELLITIMSSLAQEESRSISKNVTWGMRESMRQGKAYVPYSVFLGYDKGPDGEWVVVPEQAALVRRIYGMFLQGMSPYHICKTLEQEGIEFSPGKKKWHPTTVKSILTNEKYKGDALRQKTFTADFLTKEKIKNDGEREQYYIRDHHEAIISPEVFELVQFEMKKRGTAEERRGGTHLFSLMVKCGDCGGWFGPCTWGYGTSHERLLMRCSHKYKKGKKVCAPPAVDESVLKTAFVNAANRLFANKEKVINDFRLIGKDIFNVDSYKVEKEELINELQIVEELFATAIPEQYINLTERQKTAEIRIAEIDEIIKDKKLRKKKMEEFMDSIKTQELLRSFDESLFYNTVDYMTVYRKDLITVTFKDGTTIQG